MKNKPLMALMMIMVFPSLGGEKPTNIDIEGKWGFYSSTIDGKTEVFNYDGFVEMDLCKKKHHYHFSKNTFKIVKIDFHSCGEQFTVAGTYNINSDTLTLVPESESLFEGTPQATDVHKKITIKFSIENEKLILKDENSISEYHKIKPAS